ncbi:DUF881 domain-containing protein [Nocardioides sp. SYSU DS0663]|uniref:DUF881 domain-containing protein n=1 Tax=Nocardioides sp. SYSU DS0663 TaxID=3416445 RepID=UPI003F4BC428
MPERGQDQAHPGAGSTETPPTGRDRLRHALFRPSRSQVVVGVLLALVGFAGIVQVRATEVDDTYAGLREQDLIDVLNGLAGTTQRAESELRRLEEARDDLRSDSDQVRTALEEAQSEVATLSVLAGLTPVTGPGIRITITETDRPVEVQDMLDLVQELRTVGAEAMQVNGKVRLVASTSFAQTEGGLLVDGELVGPPYVIDAIGEPHTLEGAVTFHQGPQDAFEADHAVVEVEQRQTLDIESVRDLPRTRFAELDPDE